LPSFSTTRRRFLYSAAAAGALGVGGDSLLLEPNRPRIVRKDFFLRRWPQRLDGFTIAFISDFHYDPIFSLHPLHAAIPMVMSLRPDMITLGGDFVSAPVVGDDEKAARAADPCAQLLRQLSAPFGVWAILGNHDCFTDPRYVTHALQSQGIPVLANQSVAIEKNGARFWLAGINDALSRSADLGKTLRKIPAGEPVVLLAHEPDFADQASAFPIDLQISGHSHGGQIRLPVVMPFYLPSMGRKYVLGTYQVGPLPLYTNAGLGTVLVPLRWNCPPEITLLSLRSSRAGA
jgi:predicted MPP superfamily phosphohydrolase